MSMTETKTPANVVPMAQSPWQMTADIYSSPASFEHAQRVAKAFAASALVPEHLRKNPADALAALGLARAMNVNPLLVFQSIYFIGGKAGWSTQFMIARANQSGSFKGRITWASTGTGKDLTVTAKAKLAETGEDVSVTVSMQMAMAEEWTRNKKYQTMPEHMLRWRSAAMLIRLFAPEVMFGLPAQEELEDAPQQPMQDVTPRSTVAALDAFAADVEVLGTDEIDSDEAEVSRTLQDGDDAENERAAAEAAHIHCEDLIEKLADMPNQIQIDAYVALIKRDLDELPEAERGRFNAAKYKREKAVKGK